MAYKLVKWKKPPALGSKLNTDGCYVEGNCGIRGVISDSEGKFTLAYSLYIGPGTSNYAESMAMLFGLQQCVQRGLYNIIAEADLKLVTSCVTENTTIPWRIIELIGEIKKIVTDRDVTVKHCFR
ncbi:uncharacterized protein [Nicotiana sylvestris]|uniref:uncharacterized protein n=1 Tax=Nicotiana sylvestris TaxID=4096 RepID=UPI00388C6B79